MKKVYVTPSLKVMKIGMNAMVMASGNAKEEIDWTAGESGSGSGVDFVDYGNSNSGSPDWDF